MSLVYYHAEPLANSLKSMIPLMEKGLDYESRYVDLHKFEQHSDWFTAINPEGQVPVLDHDGVIITHTTVINEYLEDAFPDANPADGPLRPRDPARRGPDAVLEQVRRRARDEPRLDARLAPPDPGDHPIDRG
jgi:glutathione S-transferase